MGMFMLLDLSLTLKIAVASGVQIMVLSAAAVVNYLHIDAKVQGDTFTSLF